LAGPRVFLDLVRRLCVLVGLLGLAAASPPAGAATSEQALRASLGRSLAGAGSHSGALVLDLSAGRTLFSRRADVARIPASNEKLYTTSAALARFGPTGQLTTTVLGDGTLGDDGTYSGDLYLRGGGDPTFGSASFNRRAYGAGATVEALADQLAALGISKVTGSVVGDESYFDRLRGSPAEGFALSYEVEGELSGLSYNRGLASEDGGAFQSRPATFAAGELARRLRQRGVRVARVSREGATPAEASVLAGVRSPTMAAIARLTNVPSDNFFAEMLIKGLGARFGAGGSTAAGAAVIRGWLRQAGIRARVVDGSGLSRGDRTTPREVVRLLTRMRRSPGLAAPFARSLAVACRSGTLAGRMCGTAASGRCRAKTGTLDDVSALSGYCTTRGGRLLAFSILMNRVRITGARYLQNRMAAAIAAYRPSATVSRRPRPGASAAPARR
jgi:D-alanyl-D-alanine carboxypeptidase/D-alanyl-D-alanine-endopeptidase (penicillin-binding protein 4)